MLRRKVKIKQDGELDITSFMNLMIVLVPVLLMMMVFSRITVLELRLPELSVIDKTPAEQLVKDNLELVVNDSGIDVFFPQGYLLKSLPKQQDQQDYEGLQSLLKQIKLSLQDKQVEKREISLLLTSSIDYQTIVRLMDTSRAYPEVVAASVVQAELFPDISLGDAPQQDMKQ